MFIKKIASMLKIIVLLTSIVNSSLYINGPEGENRINCQICAGNSCPESKNQTDKQFG